MVLYGKADIKFENARSTGRRRDINKAIQEADRLEELLAKRYEGNLWTEEIIAEQIDPRLKRKDDNLTQLNQLKGDICECIASIRKEFVEASKPGDPEKGENIK